MKKTITYPIFVFCTLFSFTFLQTGWGQSWVLQNSNEDHPIMCVDAVDENIVWAGGWEGSIIRTLDGGENWSSITVPDTESFDFYSIAAINADTAYFAGSAFNSIDARVYKTTDGGANWELQYQNTQPEAFFNSIAFYDASNGIAISDQINGGFLIITTDDGGATWTEVPAANIPPAFPGEFSGFGDGGGTCLTLYGDSTAWFGTAYGTASNDSTRVFKSTDRGQNWTAVNTPYSVGAQFRGLSTIAFKDSLNGFAAGSDGIISTTDGGQSWSMVTSFDPPNFGVGTLVIVPETDGQVLMVSTQEGTYYSEDGGGSWMNFGSGIFVGLSFVNPTTGWAANFFEPGQGGLISRFEGNLATAVAGVELGDDLNLHHFPNPFKYTTTISYDLHKMARVKLQVLNANGQVIETLADGTMTSGRHQVLFNGKDLSPGVYFYQLQVEGRSINQKMVLIK